MKILFPILVSTLILTACSKPRLLTSDPKYQCTLSIPGFFNGKYKNIEDEKNVTIDIQLDIQPYVDWWGASNPRAKDKSRFLNFLGTSNIKITPTGDIDAEFSIKEVLVQNKPSLDKIIIYADIKVVNQMIGGVNQLLPAIISFIDPAGAAINDDKLALTSIEWNAFSNNSIALTSPNDVTKYTPAIIVPRAGEQITVTNCSEF